MYCQNCGKYNENDAAYCEFCGEQIQDNQPERYTPTSLELMQYRMMQFKEFFGESWDLICILFGIAVFVVAFATIGKTVSDPDQVAKRYFTAVMHQDWSRVYSMLDIADQEHPFLDEDLHFPLYARRNLAQEESSYIDYEIKSNSSSSSAARIHYTVEYELPSGYTETMSFTLKKLPHETSWLFYDAYAVDIPDLTVTDVSILAPENSEVYFDGFKIPLEYCSISSQHVADYSLPIAFGGEHSIKVEMPNCKISDQDSSSVIFSNGMVFDYTDMVLREKLSNTVLSSMLAWLESLTSSILQGQKLTMSNSEIPINDSGMLYMTKMFTSIMDYWNGESAIVTDILLDNVYITNSQYIQPDGSFISAIFFDYQYTYQHPDEMGHTVVKTREDQDKFITFRMILTADGLEMDSIESFDCFRASFYN